MSEAQQLQSPSKDDSKQLKKLLESHLAVLEHKLGRPPSLEELTGFLKGAEQPAGEGEVRVTEVEGEGPKSEMPPAEDEPKVLAYKVYTGVKSEGANCVPDPRKVLFYETGDGRCYDTTRHEWCPERPSIIDHLPSRPMMFDEQGHDIMSALVHGVLDDEDYDALDKAQMLNDHHKRVWELNKQLQAQVGQLEKSDELEEAEKEPYESEKPTEGVGEEEKNDRGFEAFGEGGEEPGPGSKPYWASDFDSAESAAEAEPQDGGDLKGENVLEQIIRGAMEQVLEAQEAKIESMVRAAFDRCMSQFIQLLEQDDQPEQEFETAPQPQE